MKFNLFCTILSFSLFVACKTEKVKQSSDTSSNAVKETPKNTIPANTVSRTTYGKLDDEFIKRSQTQKPYLMITDSLWLFYAAINPSKSENKPIPFEKTWLDLKENGEFEYGIAENLIDKGRYTYDQVSTQIEMRSALKDSSSLWRIKVDPDAMILIGEEKYGNSPWQIKLVRRSNFNQPNR